MSSRCQAAKVTLEVVRGPTNLAVHELAGPLSFVLAKLSPKPVGLALFAVFRGQGSSSVRKKCRVKCDGFDKIRVGEEVKAEVKVPVGVERASKVVFSWEACDGGGTPSGGAKDFTVNLR